ncbi:hypothetical protein [Altericista sp. CCNU0014]|uniref:hypothetical protein n=1 Tax=Altericista sp. CCNU0014 TaxID=3082949 RepID=UPI003850291A
MAEINDLAQKLLELDEDELEAMIGMRSQSQSRSGVSGETDDSLDSLEEDIDTVPKGGLNDFLNAGKDFFAPINAQAYKYLCSDIDKDSELGKALSTVMSDKTTEAAAKVTAFLSPVLVTQFALPQALAVLIGTLIVKKVAKGASDFTCSNWKKSLEGEAAA